MIIDDCDSIDQSLKINSSLFIRLILYSLTQTNNYTKMFFSMSCNNIHIFSTSLYSLKKSLLSKPKKNISRAQDIVEVRTTETGDESTENVASCDVTSRKPRRSWKHLLVNTKENTGGVTIGNGGGRRCGVYACDECDKTFTKQSSLARHKYEHSGMSFVYLSMTLK